MANSPLSATAVATPPLGPGSLATASRCPETICLVACSASKLSRTARAEDLYTGGLFRLSRQYAERFADRWYILSAKHQLLYPCTEVAPYDQSLIKGGSEGKKAWGKATIEQFAGLVQPLPGARILLLAGEEYCWPILRYAGRFLPGRVIERPLQGLAIGQQMAWLKRQLAASTHREGGARTV